MGNAVADLPQQARSSLALNLLSIPRRKFFIFDEEVRHTAISQSLSSFDIRLTWLHVCAIVQHSEDLSQADNLSYSYIALPEPVPVSFYHAIPFPSSDDFPINQDF